MSAYVYSQSDEWAVVRKYQRVIGIHISKKSRTASICEERPFLDMDPVTGKNNKFAWRDCFSDESNDTLGFSDPSYCWGESAEDCEYVVVGYDPGDRNTKDVFGRGFLDLIEAFCDSLSELKKLVQKLCYDGRIVATCLDPDDWGKNPWRWSCDIPGMYSGSGEGDDLVNWGIGNGVAYLLKNTFGCTPNTNTSSDYGFDY